MLKRPRPHMLLAILLVSALLSCAPRAVAEPTDPAARPVGAPAERIIAIAEKDRSRIYAYLADGSRVLVADEPFERLILPQFEGLVALSPDRRTLAYVTADDESLANAHLWIASTDGDQHRLLAVFPRGLWVTRPAWAPDGSALALTVADAARESGDLLLAIVRVADGDQRRLRVPGLRPEVSYHTPGDMVAWSVQGVQIRDALSAPGRMLVQTVDPGTGDVATQARPLTSAEIAAQLDTYALPCAVPPYAQTDPRWSGHNMLTCNLSIGEAGCALTSAAMVFGYYGATRNPAQLNTCLETYACPIYWNIAAAICSDGLATYVDYLSFSWPALESTLAGGQPIIVRFARNSNPSWTHFVVAIGGAGESADGYTILDSWDGETKSMAAYVGNGWSATGLVRYSGEPACLSADNTPPTGGITAPLTDTIVTGPTLQLAGWARDEGGSGLASAQLLAHYGGTWRPVGPTFTTSTFSYTWDPCADGVPPGPLALGLYLRDRAGNAGTTQLPLVHLTLATDCAGLDRCQPPDDGVALYAEPGYRGACHILGPGDHSTPWSWGLVGNDNVASVRVGSLAQITLYEHEQFGGRAQTLTYDNANLADNPIDANTVTSARVLSRTAAPATPTLDYPSANAAYDAAAVLTLAWRGAAGATAYRAELWSDPTIKTTVGWQPDTYWRIGSLAPGATYSWRVQARGPGGESPWSETRQFTVAPTAPADLRAVPGCALVDLTWQAVPEAVSYQVYRDGAYLGSTPSPAETYRDTTASPGTSYSYTVRARNGTLESTSSVTVHAAALACPGELPELRPLAGQDGVLPLSVSTAPGAESIGPVYAGEVAYVTWRATNDGAAVASPFTVSLRLDGDLVAAWQIASAPSGWQGVVADWPLMVAEPGWHTLSLLVDDGSRIAEASETNNAWTRAIYWIPTTPLTESFEQVDGAWEGTGLWRLGGTTSPYPPNHTGDRGWWYGRPETGTYDTGIYNAGHLTSMPIRLPEEGYRLRFWYRVETESPGVHRDQRWVQLSVDGGPFLNLLQLEGEPVDTWLPSPPIDLSSYAGHDVRVRLRMDTIDESRNAHAGWAVDDLTIALEPTLTCGDPHELNDSPDAATPLALDAGVSGAICPNGDTDYYRFTVDTAARLLAELTAMGSTAPMPTALTLLDTAGSPLAEERRDLAPGETLRLAASAPAGGAYLLRVRAAQHPATGGADHAYSLTVTRDDTSPIIADLSVATGAWITTTNLLITATVQDAGSGVAQVRLLWHSGDWGATDWEVIAEGPPEGDAWSATLSASSLPEQEGATLYLQAYDHAGNWAGRGAWLLGLDRTPPTGGLTLQGGAAVSYSRRVAATVSGQDADAMHGAGIAGMQFRIGENPWSPWEPYQPTRWVLLPDEPGIHTVSMRLRDPGGNLSPVYQASIRYQRAAAWLYMARIAR